MPNLSLPRADMYLVVCGGDIASTHKNVVDAFEDAERASKELNETFAVYRMVGEAQAITSHVTVLF